jgi:hypothetical protein
MESKKQLVLITGYPRGGTTFTAQMFKEMPKVFCRWEGRLFFGDDIFSLYDRIKEGIYPWFNWISHRKNNWLNMNDYIYTVDNKKNFVNRIFIDKSLTEFVNFIVGKSAKYLMEKTAEGYNIDFIINKDPVSRPNTLNRLFSFIEEDEGKVVFIKRDIKDTMISSALTHWKYKKDGGIGIDPLTEEDVIQTDFFLNGRNKHILTEKTIINMSENLSRIYEEAKIIQSLFPKHFKIFFYDDVYKNPEETLKKMCSFIGYDPNDEEIFEAVEKAGGFSFEKNQEGAIINDKIKMDGSSGKGNILFTEEDRKIINSIEQKILNKKNTMEK